MGHKVHPNGFRLGIYKGWEANWFALRKDYTNLLREDLDMRSVIAKQLRNAGISRVETERSSSNQLTVTIHTAKPGIVIGKQGSSVDHLRNILEKRFQTRVRISIQEIKQPELDAQLVAESIASQIERRIAYRRAIKQSIMRTMRVGALGIRVAAAGRLRGAEMARREWGRQGQVPLHTLRADIDFGRVTARTAFGTIGVKVWIYRGQLQAADKAVAPIEAPVEELTVEVPSSTMEPDLAAYPAVVADLEGANVVVQAPAVSPEVGPQAPPVSDLQSPGESAEVSLEASATVDVPAPAPPSADKGQPVKPGRSRAKKTTEEKA